MRQGYFTVPNRNAALVIARVFGFTKDDADGVEQFVTTDNGSATYGYAGDGFHPGFDSHGRPIKKLVKVLCIQTLSGPGDVEFDRPGGRTKTVPISHRIA